MRDDIEEFRSRSATVLAIAPHTPDEIASFTDGNAYPFPLLADPEHQIFDAYDVASRAMSLGQRPAVFVVDRGGTVRFDSVGTQQLQIPSNAEVLAVIDGLHD